VAAGTTRDKHANTTTSAYIMRTRARRCRGRRQGVVKTVAAAWGYCNASRLVQEHGVRMGHFENAGWGGAGGRADLDFMCSEVLHVRRLQLSVRQCGRRHGLRVVERCLICYFWDNTPSSSREMQRRPGGGCPEVRLRRRRVRLSDPVGGGRWEQGVRRKGSDA